MRLQMTRFGRVLRLMNERAAAGRGHQVQGDLALAGKLTEKHILGWWNTGLGRREYPDGVRPIVQVSDTASIQSGAFVIRSVAGSTACLRTHPDQYVYIPFASARGHNACVMRIDQLVLVRRANMGWRNDEARLAVGTLWDHLAVRRGVGLESVYNDDPSRGACRVPRALWLSPLKKAKGYQVVVFIRQIHCPCVYIPDPIDGDIFLTITKMGYRGRKDLLWNVGCGQPASDVERER